MMHILLVDSSDLMRQMLIRCLNEIPEVQFAQCCAGMEALALIKKNPCFDIILCEAELKDMQGEKLFYKLKNAEWCEKLIPMILIGTNAEAQKVIQAKETGIAHYILKPFTKDKLIHTVEETVRKHASDSPYLRNHGKRLM